jgi:hypothetical protein
MRARGKRENQMEKSNFEVWLSVNENGDAAVSLEGPDEAREALIEEQGGAAIRTVKLAVTMALREIAEVEVEVSDEAGEIREVEAKAA